MLQSRQFRAFGMALSVIVLVVMLTVVGSSMQKSTNPVRASGSGGLPDPCYSPSSSAPLCKFKGFSAKALYDSIDQSTCASGVYTGYSVYATDNVATDSAYPTATGPLVTVFYYRWDSCHYQFTTFGTSEPAAIQTTGELGSAKLQATVQLHDWYNNPFKTLTIDLTWDGIGPLSTTVQDISERTGNSVFRSRFTGSDRMATVTGTISDGTTTVNINDYTTMYDAKGGSISIEHA